MAGFFTDEELATEVPIAPVPEPETTPIGGALETAEDSARSLAEGTMFGFAGETANALGTAAGGFGGAPRAAGRGIDAPLMSTGDKARQFGADLERESDQGLELARQRSPIASGISEIGGAVATSGLPGGAIAKLAGKVAPKLVQAAAAAPRVMSIAEGAGVGALEAVGRDQDPGMGAAIGAGGGLAGMGIAAGARRVREMATRWANMSDESLLRAAGFERGTINQVQAKADGVEDLAKGIREEGYVAGKTLPEARDFLEEAKRRLPEAGRRMDAVVQQLDATGNIIDGRKLARLIEAGPVAAARKGGDEAGVRLWQGKADDLHARGTLSFSDAHAVRQTFDSMAKHRMEADAAKKLARSARGILNDQMTAAASRVSPDLAAAWKQANRSYGVAAEILRAGKRSVVGKRGNLPLGLSDLISGGAGATAGAAVAGPLGMMAGPLAAAGVRQVQRKLPYVSSRIEAMASRGASRMSPTAGQGAGPGLAAAFQQVQSPPERHEDAPQRDRLRVIITPDKKPAANDPNAALDNIIREALDGDPVDGAATYYTTSVNNPEYREKRPYNAE